MPDAIISTLACLLGALTTVAAAPTTTRQCGNTTTLCPVSGQCCAAQYSPTKFGCRLGDGGGGGASWPPSPTAACCMPGPALEPSTTLPNCLVVGDSVSIGYTSFVNLPSMVADVCQLQHAPFDVSDGGAGATSVGVACLNNWLVTQRQTAVQWDVIMFNFGLHDLDNASAAEASYRAQLQNITARLNATGATLMYATTTPFMPDTTVGNHVVDDLNRIAREVVQPFGNMTIVDLHKVVTDHCGTVYEDCDWCRRHPCSYHYNSDGETAQAKVVAQAFRDALKWRVAQSKDASNT